MILRKFLTCTLMASYINMIVVEPLLATCSLEEQIPQRPIKAKIGEDVFELFEKSDNFLHINFKDLVFSNSKPHAYFTFAGNEVAQLVSYGNRIVFISFNDQNFYFENIPRIDNLQIVSKGSNTFGSKVHCRDSFDLTTSGTSKFLDGLVVDFGSGVFKSNNHSIEFSGSVIAQQLQFKGLDCLKLQKDSILEAEFLALTDSSASFINLGNYKANVSAIDAIDFLNNGDFNSGTTVVKAHKITNRGRFVSKQTKIEVENFTNLGMVALKQFDPLKVNLMNNSGHFTVEESLVVPDGVWHNKPKGVVKVGDRFHGSFSMLRDEGYTKVGGFAYLKAESGKLSGKLRSKSAIISFKDNLNIPTSAEFYMADHLAIHTDGNLDLSGTIQLKARPSKNLNPLSKETFKILSSLSPGAFISAKGSIRKMGFVNSHHTSLSFSSEGDYKALSGSTSSGFFDGNHTFITSKTALLEDVLYTQNNLMIVSNSARLAGSRKVKGVLGLNIVDSFLQTQQDDMEVDSIIGVVGKADLYGGIDLHKAIALKVRGAFSLHHSATVQGGSIAVYAKDIDLDGSLRNGRTYEFIASNRMRSQSRMIAQANDIHFHGKYVDIYAGSQTSTSNSTKISAESTVSMLGLIRSAKDTAFNAENLVIGKAAQVRSGATTLVEGQYMKNYGELFATDHILKLGLKGYFLNRGTIKSNSLFYIDTGVYINFLGSISSDNCSINSDWLAINFLANLSSKRTEINTLFNFSILSRVFAQEQLTINALVLNADFLSLMQSNAYTSNSLVNLSQWTLLTGLPITFALPSSWNLGIDFSKPIYEQPLLQSGLSLLQCIVTGNFKTFIDVTQFLFGAKSLVEAGKSLINNLGKHRDKEWYRPSRLSKYFGQMLSFSISAANLAQSGYSLFKAGESSSGLMSSKPITDLMQLLGGSITVNSLFNYSNSVQAAPIVTRYNVFDFDHNVLFAVNATSYAAFAELRNPKFALNSFGAHSIWQLNVKKSASIYTSTVTLDGGQTNLEDGLTIVAKTGKFGRTGIDKVDELYEQKGKYRNFSISDSVHVTTDGNVTFTASADSASKNFFLNADSVTLAEDVILHASCINSITAENGDVILGAGSKFIGDVFVSVYASHDVIGAFSCVVEEYVTPGGTKKERVTAKNASIIGGVGIEYEYTDPDTGETYTRRLGLSVGAGNRIHGTAMQFISLGDIQLKAQNGIENQGHAQEYLYSEYKEKNKTHTKTRTTWGTEFFTGMLFSKDGKILITVPNGTFKQAAGIIHSAEGTDCYTLGDIESPVMKGTITKTLERKYKKNRGWAKIIHGKDWKKRDEVVEVLRESHTEGPVRYVSSEGSIKMPGRMLEASNSVVTYNAKSTTFDNPVLNHWKTSSGSKFTFIPRLFKLKNGLKSLKDVPKAIGHLRENDPKKAYTDLFSPEVSFAFGTEKKNSHWQSVLPASQNIGELHMRGDLMLQNGYVMNVVGDAHFDSDTLTINSAVLSYSTKTHYRGAMVTLDKKGVMVGGSVNNSDVSGQSHVNSILTVGGNTSGRIDTLHLNGGIFQTERSNAEIIYLEAATPQNTQIYKFLNGDAQVGLTWSAQPKANFSFSGTPSGILTRDTLSQTSGLFVGEAQDGFEVGSAQLQGAELQIRTDNGAKIGPIVRKDLPKDVNGIGTILSGSLGISPTESGFEPTVDLGCNQKSGRHTLGYNFSSTYTQNNLVFSPSVSYQYAGDHHTFGFNFPLQDFMQPLDRDAIYLNLSYSFSNGTLQTGNLHLTLSNQDWFKIMSYLPWQTNKSSRFSDPLPSLEMPVVSSSDLEKIRAKIHEMFLPEEVNRLLDEEFKHFIEDESLIDQESMRNSYDLPSLSFETRPFPLSAFYPLRLSGCNSPLADSILQQTIVGNKVTNPYQRSASLSEPLVINMFDGRYIFKTGIGHNGYLQDPLQARAASKSIYFLNDHPSPLARKSFQTLIQDEVAILFFPNREIGILGSLGSYKRAFTESTAHLHHKHFVGIGASRNEAWTSSILAHESTHCFLSSGINTELKPRILSTFSHDMKRINFSSLDPTHQMLLKNPYVYLDMKIPEEILCHLVQLDTLKPNWVAQNMPETYSLMEKIGLANTPELISVVTETHDIPHRGSKFINVSLFALDWGMHVGTEYYNGSSLSTAVVEGTVKTSIDAAVFGSAFTALGFIAGGTVSFTAGALCGIESFLPNFDAGDFAHWTAHLNQAKMAGDLNQQSHAQFMLRSMESANDLRGFKTLLKPLAYVNDMLADISGVIFETTKSTFMKLYDINLSDDRAFTGESKHRIPEAIVPH